MLGQLHLLPCHIYLKKNTRIEWSTCRAVNNEKVAARKQLLAIRSPIPALYYNITAGEFIFDLKTNDVGSLVSLFFTHKSSANFACSFKNVFIMDFTYETNCFGIPSLNKSW
jgi:hypothetical protein